MPGKTALTGACALTFLLGLLLAGCGKDYRQIAVVDGGKVELVTYGTPPKEPQTIWQKGRMVAFRTNSSMPGAPAGADGKAGHIYRVSDGMKLEEEAQFPATVPNDTLAYTFGK